MLRHIVDMTRKRDRAQLDIAAVHALYQVENTLQVKLHDIIESGDGIMVRTKAWIRQHEAVAIEEDAADAGEGKAPLSAYPALAALVHGSRSEFEERHAGGCTLWLPVLLNRRIDSWVQIDSSAPLAADTRKLIQAVLEIYSNNQHLIDYGERDSLTGLLNRKTFEEKFAQLARPIEAQEYAAATRQEERRLQQQPAAPHWLAVLDIDHFKKINDRFGHLYGDEVLLLVADILKSSFRLQDRIFRFGGEEFVILLRSVSLESAFKAFERLRQRIAQHAFPPVSYTHLTLPTN